MVGALEETNYLINLWKFDPLNLDVVGAALIGWRGRRL